MEEERVYLNFPIQLLQGFMLNKETVCQNIMHYAIYAQSLNPKLNGSIEKKFKDCADNFFGISLGNFEYALQNGIELYDSIPEKSPMAGIGKGMLFDFYKNKKSEFEKISLVGFLTLKSILGTKDYCKTNNSLWLARMDGQPKAVKLDTDDFLGNKSFNEYKIELSEEINKFANEYQTKKIKNELRNNWGLVTYSRFTKGFYISFNVTDSKGKKRGLNLKELIEVAEISRKSNKQLEYKQKEKELLKEVLQGLKTPPKHDHVNDLKK